MSNDTIDLKESSEKKPLAQSNKQRGIQPEEYAHDRKTRRKAHLSIIGIAIIALSVAFIFGCCVFVWYTIRQDKQHKEMTQTTDTHIASGEYDDARHEADRAKYTGNGITTYIKKFFATKTEHSIIDDEEKEDLSRNGITVGRSSKDFINMPFDKAFSELVARGFLAENIEVTPTVDNSKKYKDVADGTIIDIRIGDKKKFDSKQRFHKDSVIEIYYLKHDQIIAESPMPTEDPKNMITIGIKSSDFSGLTYEEAITKLIDRGFLKENIRVPPLSDYHRIFSKPSEGSIIGIRIGETEKFDAKERFPIDSIIEIYCYHVESK